MEDYFVGHGEETGRWVGRGAEALGLSGEAGHRGSVPAVRTRAATPSLGSLWAVRSAPDNTAVAGYALSFSPPKSVSILWALADDGSVSEVRDGHDAAVEAALEFLQDHAAFTRRGHGGTGPGSDRRICGRGVRASHIPGRRSATSQPCAGGQQGPGRSPIGRWLAIDGRELYEVQKAAGMLYKAALRAELTARLGVAWTEVDDNGGAEIVGVPERSDPEVLQAPGPGRSGRGRPGRRERKRPWAGP